MQARELILERVPLFSRLPRRSLTRLRSLIRIAEFEPGDIVLREGSIYRGRVYLILQGKAAAFKQGSSPYDETPADYEVAVHGRHDVLGATSLLAGEPLAFTIAAKTRLKVAVLDFRRQAMHARTRRIKMAVFAEIRRSAVSHVKASMAGRVETLRQMAAMSSHRHALGHLIVATLSLLSFYTLALSFLPRLHAFLDVNFAVTPIVIGFFALAFLPVILFSGIPPAFFGLQLDNWRYALAFSLSVSLLFLAAAMAVKAALMIFSPAFADMTLITFADIQVNGAPATSTSWYWAALALYLVLTPIQEFVARCGIQAPLYAFLSGTELKRRAWSLFVSNLVFAAAHAHISLTFALAAFLPGLFWGWIFARTNSLLAASVSHFILGGAGIFLFGIEEFVQRLAAIF